MNKIAVTTILPLDKYLSRLSLIKKAWNRLGYELAVGVVNSPKYTIGSNLQIIKDNSDVFTVIDVKNNEVTSMKALRFWMASNYIKGSDFTLIVDPMVLPISKDHFNVDEFDKHEMIHFNATPFIRFNQPQLPDFYYGASYKAFHKYFVRDPDPIGFLKSFLPSNEVERPGFEATKCIQKMTNMRCRFINTDVGGGRFTIQDEVIDRSRFIIDFDCEFNDNAEQIYNELIKIDDERR